MCAFDQFFNARLKIGRDGRSLSEWMFYKTEFETRREMLDENRDQLSRDGGEGRGSGNGGSVLGRRESSRGSSDEPDLRNRPIATMISLPRTGQFASVSQNQKIAKTEKNRQRLIMESRGTVDVLDKERRLGIRQETLQNNWRLSAANCSAIARFAEESGDEKVINLSKRLDE